MLRFLARALGSLLLAVAVVYAVGDIAKTLADDALTLTSLAAAGEGLGVGPAAEGAAVSTEGGWRAMAATLLAPLWPLPAGAVLGGAALVLLLLGRARRSRPPLATLHRRG